jgi:hypothetical protein
MHVVHVGVSFLFFVCWRNVQRICRHRRFTSSTLACIHASVAFLQNEALAVLDACYSIRFTSTGSDN